MKGSQELLELQSAGSEGGDGLGQERAWLWARGGRQRAADTPSFSGLIEATGMRFSGLIEAMSMRFSRLIEATGMLLQRRRESLGQRTPKQPQDYLWAEEGVTGSSGADIRVEVRV